jgi:hypothetical protein
MSVAEKKTRAIRLAVPVLLVLLLMVFATILVMRFFVTPRLSFKREVVRPIPRSVHDIRVNRCEISTLRGRLNGERQRAVVLRFAINMEHLSQIVAEHALKRVDYVKCANGRLEYGFRDGLRARRFSEIDLYRQDRRPASSWYDLEQWTDIEAYVLERDFGTDYWMDVRLLLYSEQFRSAYFIRYQGNVVTGQASWPSIEETGSE